MKPIENRIAIYFETKNPYTRIFIYICIYIRMRISNWKNRFSIHRFPAGYSNLPRIEPFFNSKRVKDTPDYGYGFDSPARKERTILNSENSWISIVTDSSTDGRKFIHLRGPRSFWSRRTESSQTPLLFRFHDRPSPRPFPSPFRRAHVPGLSFLLSRYSRCVQK